MHTLVLVIFYQNSVQNPQLFIIQTQSKTDISDHGAVICFINTFLKV
jgi:hypothetical protein